MSTSTVLFASAVPLNTSVLSLVMPSPAVALSVVIPVTTGAADAGFELAGVPRDPEVEPRREALRIQAARRGIEPESFDLRAVMHFVGQTIIAP